MLYSTYFEEKSMCMKVVIQRHITILLTTTTYGIGVPRNSFFFRLETKCRKFRFSFRQFRISGKRNHAFRPFREMAKLRDSLFREMGK